jgi:LPPG:FO 2-phospho-L-lactate transferase
VNVVVLAGGTGGAKLARGLLDVVGDDLVVIANTADDVEVYGAHVSPDPDLCTFWLADRIDERGWGLRDDSFNVMDGLREIGVDVWFNLGDRDLAIGIERARRLADGARLTETLAELGTAFGLRARVLPMTDAPVSSRIRTRTGWRPFQEFMIRDRGAGPIEDFALDGIDEATAPAEVLEAIASADAIVIGPSNPILSIGPILAVPGIDAALRACSAPVVAVSPIVGGAVVKGPTEPFMTWAGLTLSGEGIAACYGDLLDGIVSDEPVAMLPSLQTDTLMTGPEQRGRLAAETIEFARTLR